MLKHATGKNWTKTGSSWQKVGKVCPVFALCFFEISIMHVPLLSFKIHFKCATGKNWTKTWQKLALLWMVKSGKG
jgi:hypothetical protein